MKWLRWSAILSLVRTCSSKDKVPCCWACFTQCLVIALMPCLHRSTWKC